jgi:hypothetical protein
MPEATALMPCPFCGSAPIVSEDLTSEDWAPWIVRCTVCRDSRSATVEAYGETRDEAMSRWGSLRSVHAHLDSPIVIEARAG